MEKISKSTKIKRNYKSIKYISTICLFGEIFHNTILCNLIYSSFDHLKLFAKVVVWLEIIDNNDNLRNALRNTISVILI